MGDQNEKEDFCRFNALSADKHVVAENEECGQSDDDRSTANNCGHDVNADSKCLRRMLQLGKVNDTPAQISSIRLLSDIGLRVLIDHSNDLPNNNKGTLSP
jgi:hypothetical protein